MALLTDNIAVMVSISSLQPYLESGGKGNINNSWLYTVTHVCRWSHFSEAMSIFDIMGSTGNSAILLPS